MKQEAKKGQATVHYVDPVRPQDHQTQEAIRLFSEDGAGKHIVVGRAESRRIVNWVVWVLTFGQGGYENIH